MADLDIDYSIKQINNYITAGYEITNTESILVPIRRYDAKSGKYFNTFTTKDVPYITPLDDENQKIIKIGYCCEPKGHLYPIFIRQAGEKGYRPFAIGREGMYEMQPEEWSNVNADKPKVKETDIVINGIRVPANINYTLEYVEK